MRVNRKFGEDQQLAISARHVGALPDLHSLIHQRRCELELAADRASHHRPDSGKRIERATPGVPTCRSASPVDYGPPSARVDARHAVIDCLAWSVAMAATWPEPGLSNSWARFSAPRLGSPLGGDKRQARASSRCSGGHAWESARRYYCVKRSPRNSRVRSVGLSSVNSGAHRVRIGREPMSWLRHRRALAQPRFERVM